MNRRVSILFVGVLDAAGENTSSHRMAALRDVGAEVVGLSWIRPLHRPARLWRAVRKRVFGRMGDAVLGRQIEDALRERRFDALWIEKGITIVPDVLRAARAAHPHLAVVGYSPDDMMNPDNQTREFRESLPLYDVFFTTKTYNVAELTALGARRVVFVGNAYHPALHRPIELSPDERRTLGGAVGFIGGPERDRVERCARLAAAGVPVRIWGDRWERWKRRVGATFDVAGVSLYGEMYARIVNAFDINLCFLRKVNRDLQTTRSVEIPACGAFMLAERTSEHLDLFEEGREAEFFSSDEEMIDKARYYLAHPEQRRRIAVAGRERCIRSGYSNQDRMRFMLSQVPLPVTAAPDSPRRAAPSAADRTT